MSSRWTPGPEPTLSDKSKTRLDQLLVERGLADSKAKSQALVMAGQVKVDGVVAAKPAIMVATATAIELINSPIYASRGGQKLASVANDLAVDFKGRQVLDVGSAAGGFSDYALQHGATRIIAVDVGTGQLDWRLRNDPRVEVHEQTDIRGFRIDRPADLALIDVSFISALKVIPDVVANLKPRGQIILMAKPQFEAGRILASKHQGVIKDEIVRQAILERLKAKLEEGFVVIAQADSQVLGPKGNRERFYLLEPRG
jgi:23S rRNA (cytidine1920-2'-O)/16S rRNA (cytidine1409-2'-O)-methyltransferase